MAVGISRVTFCIFEAAPGIIDPFRSLPFITTHYPTRVAQALRILVTRTNGILTLKEKGMGFTHFADI